MSTNWNTRKLKRISASNICQAFKEVTDNDTVLLIQSQLFNYINHVITFSDLIKDTPVRKILRVDNNTTNDLRSILGSMPHIEIILLIDIRASLKIPFEIRNFLKEFKDLPVTIVYCSWQTEITDALIEKKDTVFLESYQLNNVRHLINHQLAITDRKIKLKKCTLYPFPTLDDDVLSLDILYSADNENRYVPYLQSIENASRDVMIDNISNCILSLLKEHKSIVTNFVGVGNEAQLLGQLLKSRIDRDIDEKQAFIREGLFGDKFPSGLETDLIVFDRSMDPITPLLTELTYAGMVNTLFDGYLDIEIDEEKVHFDYQKDDFWDEMKFMNFGSIGPRLNQSAKQLQKKYDDRHNAESLGEIKNFVDSLGHLQETQRYLKQHTITSTKILNEVENNEALQFNRIIEFEQDVLSDNLDHKACNDFIQDLIFEGDVASDLIIRLISLVSICKCGLREKDFLSIKKSMVDRFGINILFDIERLTEAGILVTKNTITKNKKAGTTEDLRAPYGRNVSNNIIKEYRSIAKWFATLPVGSNDDAQDISNPKEPDFAFCSVVPLSMRIIQAFYDRSILSKTYNAQQPYIISKEPKVTKLETLFSQVYCNSKHISSERWVPEPKVNKLPNTTGKKDNDDHPDIAIIVFLGGVTIGELATLKHLKGKLRDKGIKKRFLIITDGILKK